MTQSFRKIFTLFLLLFGLETTALISGFFKPYALAASMNGDIYSQLTPEAANFLRSVDPELLKPGAVAKTPEQQKQLIMFQSLSQSMSMQNDAKIDAERVMKMQKESLMKEQQKIQKHAMAMGLKNSSKTQSKKEIKDKNAKYIYNATSSKKSSTSSLTKSKESAPRIFRTVK